MNRIQGPILLLVLTSYVPAPLAAERMTSAEATAAYKAMRQFAPPDKA